MVAFPAGGVPSGWIPAPYDAVAAVAVTDQAGDAITNATVAVNGVALAYTDVQTYEGLLTINPGDVVTLTVTVDGITYTASRTEFSAYPTIIVPVPGTNWAPNVTNLMTWSGAVPDSTAFYALGLFTPSGSQVWPTNGPLQDVIPPQDSYALSTDALGIGNFLVLVGIADYVPVPDAAPGSILLLGGFNYSSVAVIAPPPPATVQSVSVSPASVTLASGKTIQLSATATFSDGTMQDVTTLATWSSSDSADVSVSASGLITGVTGGGGATVTAQYEGISGQTTVTVFQPNPSPTPPLTQAVAYQIDYAHSGGATVGSGGPTFPPQASWSTTLNGLISYPLIAGGEVFVTTNTDSSGTSSTSLYALDESTGNVLWGPIAIAGGYGWSGLAYDHGTVFVVNTPGVLSTFNAATGAPGWSEQLPDQTSFSAPPTAVNGVVYVGGAGIGGTLIAVDETDGSILWTATVENGDTSSPTVSPDGVFVAYPCQVYKFDPLIGTTLWHYNGPCEGDGGVTSAYANGELFVRTLDEPAPPGEIFDAETGNQLGPFSATAIPAFSATTGFFLNGGTLSAVDQTTQSTLWTFTGDGGLVSAPIVIDTVVVIGSSSGTVYALDAATGNVIWSGSAGAAINPPNEGDVVAPLTGLGAGDGYLVVPAGHVLSGWQIAP